MCMAHERPLALYGRSWLGLQMKMGKHAHTSSKNKTHTEHTPGEITCNAVGVAVAVAPLLLPPLLPTLLLFMALQKWARHCVASGQS